MWGPCRLSCLQTFFNTFALTPIFLKDLRVVALNAASILNVQILGVEQIIDELMAASDAGQVWLNAARENSHSEKPVRYEGMIR